MTRLPAGKLFEYRIGLVRFSQGHFVRRSVDVFPPNINDHNMAEIDLICDWFSPRLIRSSEFIECKTSRASSGEIDRILWLNGLKSLGGAQAATFAKTALDARTRRMARDMSIGLIDEAGVSEIETLASLGTSSNKGFFDPDFFETHIEPLKNELKRNTEIDRAGRYLWGRYWFDDDFTRLLRLHRVTKMVLEARTLSSEARKLALLETVVLFVHTSLSIASLRSFHKPDEISDLILASVLASKSEASVRDLLRSIDAIRRSDIALVRESLQSPENQPNFVFESIETQVLEGVDWLESYGSVADRLWLRANMGNELVRFVDLFAASKMGQAKPIKDMSFPHWHQLAVLFNYLKVFLTRYWNIPDELLETEDLFKNDQVENQILHN